MGWNIFFVISWHWPGQGQTPLLACWQDGWQVPYWKTSLLLKYVFEDNTWPLSQSCFIESSDTLRIGDKVWQLSNQLRIKKVPLVFFLFTLLNSFAPVRKSSCRHFLASSKIPLGVHGRRPYYRTGFGHRASIESWFWNEICNMNDIFNCRLKGVDFSGFLIGDNQHISCLRPRALRTLLDKIAWFEIGSSYSNMLKGRVSNSI